MGNFYTISYSYSSYIAKENHQLFWISKLFKKLISLKTWKYELRNSFQTIFRRFLNYLIFFYNSSLWLLLNYPTKISSFFSSDLVDRFSVEAFLPFIAFGLSGCHFPFGSRTLMIYLNVIVILLYSFLRTVKNVKEKYRNDIKLNTL